MTRPVLIALDGPAGAGKSSVGERLARRLGYFYFDTGVLYRAVALRALEAGVDPADEQGLWRLVAGLDVRVQPPSVGDGRQFDVLLDGRDVTWAIRAATVDGAVSLVATSSTVRGGLIDPQRRQVRPPGTVMAGRDIGTVVCPDADLKLFLVASIDERTRRRLRQLGLAPSEFESLREAIECRDSIDSSRALAPLSKACDAVTIETDGLSIDEVVDRAAELMEGVRTRGSPNERASDQSERSGSSA